MFRSVLTRTGGPCHRCEMFGRCWGLIVLALVSFSTAVSAEIKGYDEDLSDGIPAVVVDVDLGSGARTIPPEYAGCPAIENAVNTVFGVGFTSGYAFVPAPVPGLVSDRGSTSVAVGEATLYGLEFEGTDIYLHALEQQFCATGARVGTQPVGHPNLESLTYSCLDGYLYSVAFDTDAHVGYLVRIDPETGVGVRVSEVSMPRDVWIVGLVYGNASGSFYGISNGFAARNFQELYVITVDGTAIAVGPTGTEPQELQSLVMDGGGGLYAGGERLYEIDPTLGAASPVGSLEFPGTLWALANRDVGCGDVATPTVPATPVPSDTPTVPVPTPTRTVTREPSVTATPRRPVVTTRRIEPTDTTIFVEDVSFLPTRGTMRIEDEIIRYDGLQVIRASASGLGAPVPGILLNVQRGVDGSTAVAHAPGSLLIFLKAGCAGDCNNDDAVSISELILGVNIALGSAAVDTCPAMDGNADGMVSINELIGAVRAALDGC